MPVFGWLWLKGKCRDCGEPISPRYAIVELVMGLAFVALAYAELFTGWSILPSQQITEFTGAYDNVWTPQWRLIAIYACHGLLLSWLMSIALIRLDRQEVPWKLALFGIAIAVFALLIGRGYIEVIAVLLLVVAASSRIARKV